MRTEVAAIPLAPLHSHCSTFLGSALRRVVFRGR
jgi:hypothetical protein